MIGFQPSYVLKQTSLTFSAEGNRTSSCGAGKFSSEYTQNGFGGCEATYPTHVLRKTGSILPGFAQQRSWRT
jgi:hypothetical protein